MSRFLSAAVLCSGLLILWSCSSQSGNTTMTAENGSSLPPTSVVQTPARYTLYQAGKADPIWSEELKTGDEYGFVRRADGNVYGVAKGQDISLPDQAKTYLWKQQDVRRPAGDE